MTQEAWKRTSKGIVRLWILWHRILPPVFGTIKTEKLIVEGNPANIIIKAIEKKDIDVVVIANSGKNFVDRFLIGSVTERIIRCSTVPIVVIPTKSE